DRPTHLERIALTSLVDEVGRDLAVLEPLDGDCELLARRGGDRVAALSLVAVVGRQAHVEMLAGAVTEPTLGVEQERPDPRRLLDRARHLGDEPGKGSLTKQWLCRRAALLARWRRPQ